MAQNFIACDRGQSMLLPPDLMDWVPDDHVVWSILGAVEEMDLGAFYGVYRENGQGRAAYEPSMMVALLLYAYARGNRSSRGIERECREDVVYKLITAMRVPDHSTIAEFRRRHERALGELFTEVLTLCEEAGCWATRWFGTWMTCLVGMRGDGRHNDQRWLVGVGVG